MKIVNARRLKLIRAINRDPGLTFGQKTIAATLAIEADHSTGTTMLTARTVMAMVDCDDSTLQIAIAALRKTGWLLSPTSANEYRLNWDRS